MHLSEKEFYLPEEESDDNNDELEEDFTHSKSGCDSDN